MDQHRLQQRSCSECGRPNTACLYRLLVAPRKVNYICSLCGKGFGGNSSNGHYHMSTCHDTESPCVYYAHKRLCKTRRHRSVKRAESKRRSTQLTGHTSIHEHVTNPNPSIDALELSAAPMPVSPSLHNQHPLMYPDWPLLDLPALYSIYPFDDADLYPFN